MAAATSRLNGTWLRGAARLDGADRFPGLDIARSLAIIGMFAAHLVTTPDWNSGEPDAWLDIVNGRSSILFATLAGVSLALISGGARPVSGSALASTRIGIVIRALCIWGIGLALIALGAPVYVILPAYAILFLISLPLIAMRPALVWVFAAVMALVGPVLFAIIDWTGALSEGVSGELSALIGWNYPFIVWVAFVAAGIALGRQHLRRWSVLVATLVVGGGTALGGYGLGMILGPSGGFSLSPTFTGRVFDFDAHSSGIGETLGSGGFALAVIAFCLMLGMTPARWVLWPLRAMGSMPLTAYTSHLVIWAVWSDVAGLPLADLMAFRELAPFWPLTIAVVVGCSLWTLLVGRGPLEWLIAAAVRVVAGQKTVTTRPRLDE